MKGFIEKRQFITPSSTFYDKWFMVSIAGIIAIGLLMVASSSIVISERSFGQPFYYLIKQTLHFMLGGFLAYFVLQVEMKTWQKIAPIILGLSFCLLVVVLIPGIGKTVNGATRWISLGFMRVQVSEIVKLAVILYMASYLVRRELEVQTTIVGFIKPMCVVGLISILLLKEPDFGAAVVITATVIGLLYLAGVRLWQVGSLFLTVAVALFILAISAPYRLERLTTFLNPWAYQFDSGYQLTQSLIAFGRGGYFGVGLGESVQKLSYLPEAHTDFLFAVLAEEFGLVGTLFVIGLYCVLILRILIIARFAHTTGKPFSGFVGYGIGLWLGLQAIINMGVCSGLLPTKGLTLPLMSYGGGSTIMNCIALALIFRIDYELKRDENGLRLNR